ncbi:M56 family metallopeptidase [Tissierella praeacuta]|uniref:M56 family metallopeptidase n=1 Tax=Tissierella praeacuta TaxID=43131 RepID=UPI003341CE1E
MTKYLLNILALSFSIGLIIFLTLIVSKLLNKKYLIKWRYFLWIILSIRLLIPVKVNLPLIVSKSIEDNWNIMSSKDSNKTPLDYFNTKGSNNIQSLEGHPKSDAKVKANIITLKTFKSIKITYIIGLFMFLGNHIIVYLVFRRKVFVSEEVVRDEIMIGNYQRIIDEIGLKRKVRIFRDKDISTPILMGILKPAIIIPSKDYSEKEIYYILKHELMHVKRKDLEYKLLLLIVNGLHWFNPLVYIMRNTANIDLEICCDLDVLKNQKLEEKKTYCNVLLSSIEREKYGYTLATYFIGGRNEMKERFKSIISSHNKKNGFTALASIIAATFILNTFILERVEGSNIMKDIGMNMENKHNDINTKLNVDIKTVEKKKGEHEEINIINNNQNVIRERHEEKLIEQYEEEYEKLSQRSEEFSERIEKVKLSENERRKNMENISIDKGRGFFLITGIFEIPYIDELDYNRFNRLEIFPEKYSEETPFYENWGEDKIEYVSYSLNNCTFNAESDILFSVHIYAKEGDMIATIKSEEENGDHGVRVNFSDEEYYIILVNEDDNSTENGRYSIWR